MTWWSDSLECLKGPGFSLRNRVLLNPVRGWIFVQVQLCENSNKTKWSNNCVLIHSISMLPSTQLGVVMRKPYVRHLARTNKPTVTQTGRKCSYDEIIGDFCLFHFIVHQKELPAVNRLPWKCSLWKCHRQHLLPLLVFDGVMQLEQHELNRWQVEPAHLSQSLLLESASQGFRFQGLLLGEWVFQLAN